MIDASLLAQKYYASLANTRLYREKCVILFSGVPGSGKSHIARAIEQELGAIRISNDDIRDMIVAENPGIEITRRERMKLAIVARLLRFLEASPNGLVVFDASCDRPGGYEFTADWAARHDYRVVLLRMDIPRAIVRQRINRRGNTGYRKADRSLAHLEVWWQQWEAFGKRQKPDLTITPHTPLESVLSFIRRFS